MFRRITLWSSFVSITLASPLGSKAVKRMETCPFDATNTAVPAPCNAADPPFTQAESSMFDNIDCPSVSNTQDVTTPFLLVPGTGNTGAQSFDGGYVQLLEGLGFQSCFLKEPDAMLGDAQDVAERIAYAINTLSTISGKPIPTAGWSQGNLDIQWVLTFWTSSNSNTLQFISLAGDFRGTNELSGLGIVSFATPLPPSILQQETGSNFLAALARHGGLSSKVPTTSVFSATDEIIQPENNTPNATSFLSGANVGNILIQNACPGLVVTHEDELFINFTFQVVKAATSSQNLFVTPAEVASLNIPCNLDAAPGANPAQGTDAIADAVASIAASELTVQDTTIEPPVRSYAQ